MKKNSLTIVGLIIFALFNVSAYAHGTDTEISSPTGIMGMMDLMHKHMDENRSIDCSNVGDVEMMEKGEDMMEEMMGHDDHEKMESSLNKSDHDSLHLMMGMWSSGCVGDENMNTMMERYGIPGNLLNGGYRGQTNWTSVFGGIILGLIGGFAGSWALNKKPAA